MAKIRDSIFSREPLVKVYLEAGEYINFKEVNKLAAFGNRTFLKVQKIDRDNRRIVFFPQGKLKLRQFIKNPLNKDTFFIIILQFMKMISVCSSNKFPLKNVEANLEYTYINPVTLEVSFLFIPALRNNSLSLGVVQFINEMIYTAVFDSRYSTKYITELMAFMKNNPKYDTAAYIEFINGQSPKAVAKIGGKLENKSGFIAKNPAEYKKHYDEKFTEDTTGLSADEPTTMLNEESESTTLLDDTENPKPQERLIATLTDIGSGKVITVDNPLFKIGKGKGQNDYCIENNSAVSRRHADIITDNGKFYIVDNKSTNKTYLNGSLLTPEIETEIMSGDMIKLANQEYIFKIERK